MEKIIAFIITNWRLCAECFCAVLALVLFIVRKKPEKVIDGLYSALLKVIPGFIVYAENNVSGNKTGDCKLEVVINLASAYIKKLYPDCEIDDQIIDFIKSSVELILSTPQKKGE